MTIDKLNSVLKNRIEWALFLLRAGVFIVLFAWTVDKFVNPGHAVRVFEHFYFLEGFGETIIVGIGIAELMIILAFLAGMWKRFTYGFVVFIHGVSTFSAWEKYTTDINLLFFAAWPMLSACVALYLLREWDVKFTLKR